MGFVVLQSDGQFFLQTENIPLCIGRQKYTSVNAKTCPVSPRQTNWGGGVGGGESLVLKQTRQKKRRLSTKKSTPLTSVHWSTAQDRRTHPLSSAQKGHCFFKLTCNQWQLLIVMCRTSCGFPFKFPSFVDVLPKVLAQTAEGSKFSWGLAFWRSVIPKCMTLVSGGSTGFHCRLKCAARVPLVYRSHIFFAVISRWAFMVRKRHELKRRSQIWMPIRSWYCQLHRYNSKIYLPISEVVFLQQAVQSWKYFEIIERVHTLHFARAIVDFSLKLKGSSYVGIPFESPVRGLWWEGLFFKQKAGTRRSCFILSMLSCSKGESLGLQFIFLRSVYLLQHSSFETGMRGGGGYVWFEREGHRGSIMGCWIRWGAK